MFWCAAAVVFLPLGANGGMNPPPCTSRALTGAVFFETRSRVYTALFRGHQNYIRAFSNPATARRANVDEDDQAAN
jgi:hypothetical protein